MIYSTLFKIIENEKKYDKVFTKCESTSEICSICLEKCGFEYKYIFCIPVFEENREINVKLVKCQHIFHEKCIRKFIDFQPSNIKCPLCRQLYVL